MTELYNMFKLKQHFLALINTEYQQRALFRFMRIVNDDKMDTCIAGGHYLIVTKISESVFPALL